jgi:ribonucleoside-diphosphate reductase alpha chain
MRQKLIGMNGSVQSIPEIPQNLKDIYKTVWEISQKSIIDMSADRGAYICQSQSLNIHITNPNFGKLTSMHFYAWKKGLKTGLYYLRSTAAADAIKFTLDKANIQERTIEISEKVKVEDPAAVLVTATVTESQHEIKYQSKEEFDQKRADMACSLDNPDACEACGS